MAVLLSHILVEIQALLPTVWLDRALDYVGLGRIGVVAFFCISGFVIPFSFKGSTPLRNFLISRVFRLYPAYWASLAAMLAAGTIAGMRFPPAQVLANITMVQTALGQPDVINVYWTLFIEIIFYALCVIGFAAGLLNSARAVIAALYAFALIATALLILTLLHVQIDLPPLALPAYIAIMGFGTLYRLAWLDGDPLARKHVPLALAGLVWSITIVFGLGFSDNEAPVRQTADFLGIFIGLALFIAAFSAKRLLSGRIMIWFGQISYSLYVLHAVCVLVCGKLAAQLSNGPVQVLVILTAIPLSLLASHASVQLIERPMIALGRNLRSRLKGQPAME